MKTFIIPAKFNIVLTNNFNQMTASIGAIGYSDYPTYIRSHGLAQINAENYVKQDTITAERFWILMGIGLTGFYGDYDIVSEAEICSWDRSFGSSTSNVITRLPTLSSRLDPILLNVFFSAGLIIVGFLLFIRQILSPFKWFTLNDTPYHDSLTVIVLLEIKFYWKCHF